LKIANRKALLSLFDDAPLEALFPDHFNDFYQIQSMYSWNRAAFAVDLEGVMFYTLGPHATALRVQNNRLVNPDSGIAPSFVHAPNNWDLSSVEQWLATVS
jgi:hypothetical protein